MNRWTKEFKIAHNPKYSFNQRPNVIFPGFDWRWWCCDLIHVTFIRCTSNSVSHVVYSQTDTNMRPDNFVPLFFHLLLRSEFSLHCALVQCMQRPQKSKMMKRTPIRQNIHIKSQLSQTHEWKFHHSSFHVTCDGWRHTSRSDNDSVRCSDLFHSKIERSESTVIDSIQCNDPSSYPRLVLPSIHQ